MSAQYYFATPFALSGDRAAIPIPIQVGGEVSYTQGFGPDYSLDVTDPDAQRVPRLETNQYLFAITDNIRQYQLNGFPEWITAAQNGGVAVAYPINAVVIWNGGSGTDWAPYTSLIVGATAEPGTNPAQWSQVIFNLASVALLKANNLSDVANVATSRTNLGLGSMAVESTASWLPKAAPSATGGLTLSGGLIFTGATKQNIIAVAALAIDWNASEMQTKTLSSSGVFTFTGIAGGVGMGLLLKLVISGGAVPTWPAAVQWQDGLIPTFTNGTHIVGFLTFDGGTTVQGFVGGKNFA